MVLGGWILLACEKASWRGFGQHFPRLCTPCPHTSRAGRLPPGTSNALGRRRACDEFGSGPRIPSPPRRPPTFCHDDARRSTLGRVDSVGSMMREQALPSDVTSLPSRARLTRPRLWKAREWGASSPSDANDEVCLSPKGHRVQRAGQLQWAGFSGRLQWESSCRMKIGKGG